METLAVSIGVEKGVTAFVGGGGKTTTIYTLARELYEQGNTVIVTTTTKMYMPNLDEVSSILLSPTPKEMEASLLKFRLIAVGSKERDGKMIGMEESDLCFMKGLADYVLVEADGARHLPLKVPGEHEPVIPNCSRNIIAVVGMTAFNKTIKESCFRSDKVAQLLEKDESSILGAEDIAKIIRSPYGLSKGINKREFVVLLNQADEEIDRESADLIAKRLKTMGIKKIVIASLKKNRWREA